MEIEIRKADKKDINGIMRLLRQVNDVHASGRPDIFIPGHAKYNPEKLSSILDTPETPVFSALDSDGNVIGYCFCVVQDNTNANNLIPHKSLYIDDLCIDEKERGKHIGRKIFEYVKLFAEENNFYNITLNVWSCNPVARKFYESLGMKPMKTVMETIVYSR